MTLFFINFGGGASAEEAAGRFSFWPSDPVRHLKISFAYAVTSCTCQASTSLRISQHSEEIRKEDMCPLQSSIKKGPGLLTRLKRTSRRQALKGWFRSCRLGPHGPSICLWRSNLLLLTCNCSHVLLPHMPGSARLAVATVGGVHGALGTLAKKEHV